MSRRLKNTELEMYLEAATCVQLAEYGVTGSSEMSSCVVGRAVVPVAMIWVPALELTRTHVRRLRQA